MIIINPQWLISVNMMWIYWTPHNPHWEASIPIESSEWEDCYSIATVIQFSVNCPPQQILRVIPAVESIVTWYLAFYLASILTLFLTFYLAFVVCSDILSGICRMFWHSFWHFIWHFFRTLFLALCLAFSLACPAGRWDPASKEAEEMEEKKEKDKEKELHPCENLELWRGARALGGAVPVRSGKKI